MYANDDDAKWPPTRRAARFAFRNDRDTSPGCAEKMLQDLSWGKKQYGSVVWDPYLRKDIDTLERTQRTAARFITGDYRSNTPGSVQKLLHKLDLPTLQQRRQQLRLTFFYL